MEVQKICLFCRLPFCLFRWIYGKLVLWVRHFFKCNHLNYNMGSGKQKFHFEFPSSFYKAQVFRVSTLRQTAAANDKTFQM